MATKPPTIDGLWGKDLELAFLEFWTHRNPSKSMDPSCRSAQLSPPVSPCLLPTASPQHRDSGPCAPPNFWIASFVLIMLYVPYFPLTWHHHAPSKSTIITCHIFQKRLC